ncbi:cyclin-dependent kinase inhibitor 1C-like [Arapaima gigas]
MPVQRGRRVTRLHIVEHTSERWRGSSGGSFALDSVLLSSPFLSSGTLGPEMSDVQLSGSALEHAAARRTYPLHGHTGACRSLFGPVDHDELAREMKAKLREISEHDRLRWNFDFAADAPLPGQFASARCGSPPRPYHRLFRQEEEKLGEEAEREPPCYSTPRADPPQEDPIKVSALRCCDDVSFHAPLLRKEGPESEPGHPRAWRTVRGPEARPSQSNSQDSQKDFQTQRPCSRSVVQTEQLDGVHNVTECNSS